MRLFEDERVLAVNKPAGISMATSTRRDRSAPEAVARLLSALGLVPTPEEEGELRLVHRLDVGTSGVVVLAKGDEAHRALSRAFQERQVEKTYRALVWGHPRPAHGTIELPLMRDPSDGRKMRAADPEVPSAKKARTVYRTRRRLPSVADLTLHPETGRTHQIRVHLAARGHPIVGDDFYGGATRFRGVRDRRLRAAFQAVARPLLHAERLRLHALDFDLDVLAPLPEDHLRLLRLLGGQEAPDAAAANAVEPATIDS